MVPKIPMVVLKLTILGNHELRTWPSTTTWARSGCADCGCADGSPLAQLKSFIWPEHLCTLSGLSSNDQTLEIVKAKLHGPEKHKSMLPLTELPCRGFTLSLAFRLVHHNCFHPKVGANSTSQKMPAPPKLEPSHPAIALAVVLGHFCHGNTSTTTARRRPCHDGATTSAAADHADHGVRSVFANHIWGMDPL